MGENSQIEHNFRTNSTRLIISYLRTDVRDLNAIKTNFIVKMQISSEDMEFSTIFIG